MLPMTRSGSGCADVLAAITVVVCAACATHGQESSDSDDKELTFHAPPAALAEGAVTSDWPAFLGPTHDGKSVETGLLSKWPAGGPKLVWERKTGSGGFASPAVKGDRLVHFYRDGDQEHVICVDAETGRRIWSFEYATAYKDRYGFNGGPRSSPVIDADRVYTHGAEGKLYCLDLTSGKVVWKRDTSAEYDVPQNFFGVGSTPLIEGNLLIVNVGAPGGPCVVAFDKLSGKPVWTAGDKWTAGYGSPIPAVVNGKRRVFVLSGGDSNPPTGGLLSIDPASGAIDFRFPFRSSKQISVNASSPVIVDNSVFISSSYDTGGLLLTLLPNGGPQTAWTTNDLAAHFDTPTHVNGYLYGFTGMGQRDTSLVCLDLKTGKAAWTRQLEWRETLQVRGKERSLSFTPGRGSLLYVDGSFLCLGESGHLLQLDLSPKGPRVLQRAWLFNAPETWTPPVLSRGLLYITQNARGRLGKTPPRVLCDDLGGA
ncbi:MAG: PQQ-like beta-propeller repeat protein, partial [Planctomycetes bacterium]|nr:PQQ-like beta-propeller repeat protein [Planctomycetota bacterium]